MAGTNRLVVCSTGLTSEQRRSLDTAVASLAGAEYDGNLTDRTTHLVAVRSAPMTEKLRAARRLGLPIVWPSWLLDAAADGSTLSPPQPHHVLQPLSGVVVCVSGPAFSAADRQAVRLDVEAVGGAYSSVLDASCTHIVLSGAPGHKYQSALAQDLSQVAPNAVFVTSEWLTETLRLGSPQDEAQFTPALVPVNVDELPPVPERHTLALPSSTSRSLAETTASVLNAPPKQRLAAKPLPPMPTPSQQASAPVSMPPALLEPIAEPLEILRAAVVAGSLSVDAPPVSTGLPSTLFPTGTLSVGKASYRLDTLTGMRRHRAVAAALDESSTGLPALMGPQFAADAPPPPPGAGRPYSLRELAFAVRCARLSHADYFLACLTASIDPVLLLDKKLLFGAVFGAQGARAGTTAAAVSQDPADRLSQGPVSSATLAAMTGEAAGPIAPGSSRAPVAVEGAQNSTPAPAEHMRLHERLQRAEEERAALLATVSMLTRQLGEFIEEVVFSIDDLFLKLVIRD